MIARSPLAPVPRSCARIAEALRAEFGVGIDAHPGGEGNEAGVVNRAFRAVARRILMTIVTSEDDSAALVTWTLRQAALRRPAELGVSGRQVESLLDSESGLGDRWLAHLALAPASVIGDLLVGGSGSGPAEAPYPTGE